jgi:hypothetical protein
MGAMSSGRRRDASLKGAQARARDLNPDAMEGDTKHQW